MPGHSSQKNKAHKAGKRAGQSARLAHRHGKQALDRGHSGVSRASGKEARLQAACAARAKSREAVLERQRHAHAPIVVQLLPLCASAGDAQAWNALNAACCVGSDVQSLRGHDAAYTEDGMADGLESSPLKPTTVLVPGRLKMRVTLLPPPPQEWLNNPMTMADIAAAADVVLLCLPIDGGAPVDASGHAALSVLRSLGLPPLIVALQGAGSSLKERAAAKKVAAASLSSELPRGPRLCPLDSVADGVQLLRTLAELKVEPPAWRRTRPQLLLEGAAFEPGSTDASSGTLRIDAYVRHAGLNANQLVPLPGSTDHMISSIELASEVGPHARGTAHPGGCSTGPGPTVAVQDAPWDSGARLHAEIDMSEGSAEEQTWPSPAEYAPASAARKRDLLGGTSEYQACWILDADDGDDEDGGGGAAEAEGATVGGVDEGGPSPLRRGDDGVRQGGRRGGAGGEAASVGVLGLDAGVQGSVAEVSDTEMESGGEGEESQMDPTELARLRRSRKREEAQDELTYPDEMETPHDVPARERFRRYRGLKSMRSSTWDAGEGLPEEYAQIYHVENFKRTQKRALETAAAVSQGTLPGSVSPGAYVRVALVDVPAAVAASICSRVSAFLLGGAPPLCLFGVLQHECRLSVVHFSVTRHPSYSDDVANKEELVIDCGLRRFTARPVISADAYNSDKFKMERFMRPGQAYVLSVYAPISFPPLPVLVSKRGAPGVTSLVATGCLRSVDTERVVLKRLILSGYPARVHKCKATVRYMFFTPEDVKWFKPLELWTKHGRRGRIVEPLGTHGAMKCTFDAPVQQKDAVCMSLFKRVFPKFPKTMCFNEPL